MLALGRMFALLQRAALGLALLLGVALATDCYSQEKRKNSRQISRHTSRHCASRQTRFAARHHAHFYRDQY